MCYVCLQDFEFDFPSNPKLEDKKRRLTKIKSLLKIAAQMEINESIIDDRYKSLCKDKVEELKDEQYKLSRQF